MRVLNAGGSAVDAVEAAIKVLEDKEITNAGFGSNLSIDGVVECDATIVDHLGRSGACGAVSRVKNPINLARIILERSNKPLSLRRVPPNLLVGEGAVDFAYNQGIPIVPYDAVVSQNARDRYVRWKEDLRRAEGSDNGRITPISNGSPIGQYGEEHSDYDHEDRVRDKQRRDHTNAMLTGTWNEGQPDSPQPTSPTPIAESTQDSFINTRSGSPAPDSPNLTPVGERSRITRSPLSSPSRSPSKRVRRDYSDNGTRTHSLLGPSGKSSADVMVSAGQFNSSADGAKSPVKESLQVPYLNVDGACADALADFHISVQDDDIITDTVGAIAIDHFGNIAAASSSGGIGMKHRGRVGPAALVGIGTAIIPADKDDPDQVSVAAVTSGTGEHMATTMASQKCVERLYQNTRRGRGGADVSASEEDAMESFVRADFMNHPSVLASNSTGAIGVMAVKKTPYGYFLHFAHNTDSFALASMHSLENEPKCVMSRLGDRGGSIVRGGRKVRAS
ncbi:Threonine aspartase 1 [Phlyctema vagabunda]|uniref:Threonine aspartase 1 n=1 Tax=Phlyctema vagabunda TaxID=108571 RepID=A0ABR4PDY6_9HELO